MTPRCEKILKEQFGKVMKNKFFKKLLKSKNLFDTKHYLCYYSKVTKENIYATQN